MSSEIDEQLFGVEWETHRAEFLAEYADVWDGLETWRRHTLEHAASLMADLHTLELDHRERRLTFDLVAKLEKQAMSDSASASEAGRALVSYRYAKKSTYKDALRVLEGG